MQPNEAPCHSRLAVTGIYCGALVPTGLIAGSISFEVLIGLVIVCGGAHFILTGTNSRRQMTAHILFRPLIAWFGAIMICSIWNFKDIDGLAHDVAILRFLMFVLALHHLARRRNTATLLINGLAFSVLFGAVNTAAAYLFGGDLIGNSLDCYTKKYSEGFRISNICAYAAPFFFARALTDTTIGKKHRWFLFILSLLAMGLVFQSRIRTNALGMTIGILFLLVYLNRNHLSRRLALIIAGGVLLSVWFFFEKIGSWSLKTVYDRVYYWKVCWGLWSNHPLFGVGVSGWMDSYHTLAASGDIAPYVAPDGSVWKLSKVFHAHNLVLMLLSGTGLVGTGAFAWLFAVTAKYVAAFKAGNRIGMTSWPVVLFCCGLTGTDIFSSSYLTLFSFLIALIGCHENEKDAGRIPS